MQILYLMFYTNAGQNYNLYVASLLLFLWRPHFQNKEQEVSYNFSSQAYNVNSNAIY